MDADFTETNLIKDLIQGYKNGDCSDSLLYPQLASINASHIETKYVGKILYLNRLFLKSSDFQNRSELDHVIKVYAAWMPKRYQILIQDLMDYQIMCFHNGKVM
ncbi:MAG: hypothetical protein KDH96_07250 [Candidatus Riesia sp.]|nr:hypothetical protein [Candidatus Riesia sp.]